jgi:hypothetical protein
VERHGPVVSHRHRPEPGLAAHVMHPAHPATVTAALLR